mgnify:CR=1 FL=1
MLIKGTKEPRNISAGISDEEIQLCEYYIKGAVHGFCNNNSGSRFSARSLFGGENTEWKDTPLVKIYDYYTNVKGYDFEKAHKQAGIDVGLLLKAVLCKDNKFDYEEFDAYTKEYCRITSK